MSRLPNIIILILFLLIFSHIFAQMQDSVATGSSQPANLRATGDVVDLTEAAIEIKLEPDRPLVQIMTVRLKPEFDDVNLEKSFVPELLGKGEQITVRENQELEEQVIDLDKMINKKR
jgi:hypothetical protein